MFGIEFFSSHIPMDHSNASKRLREVRDIICNQSAFTTCYTELDFVSDTPILNNIRRLFQGENVVQQY